ncbi:MAG: DUF6272 family protein, partial [Flavobacteriales bacterium]
MNKEVASSLQVCENRYNEILKNLKEEKGQTIITSHFGEISQGLVSSISEEVEKVMADNGEKKGFTKRVFSILVEALQNIRLHGEKDENDNQTAFTLITYSEEGYRLVVGNLVKNSKA